MSGPEPICEEYTGKVYADKFVGTKAELDFYRVLDVNGRKKFFDSEDNYLAYRLTKAREYADSNDPTVLQKVSPYSYEPLPLWNLNGYVAPEEDETRSDSSENFEWCHIETKEAARNHGQRHHYYRPSFQ